MYTLHEEHWQDLGPCMRASNGVVDFVFPLNCGIRICGLSLAGHENLFFEQPADMTEDCCRPNGWRLRGGLRLWLAPESEKSYYPDNDPISWRRLPDGVELTQPVDGFLNLEKRVTIRFDAQDSRALLLSYAICNRGDVSIEGSLWAITTFKALGRGGFRFVSDREAILPQRFISLWNDTRLDDPRLRIDGEEVEIAHRPLDGSFKMGFSCMDAACWFAYGGQLLRRYFDFEPAARYPDGNVNLEVFQCRHMMELESLGALQLFEPNCWVERHEKWTLEAFSQEFENHFHNLQP